MRPRIFITLSVLFLLFSLLPTGYEIVYKQKIKPIRAFELVHNFPTDYNFYLSRIRQGLEGRTTVEEKYTSEPHRGSFLQEFYLVLGWVGRVLRIPPNHAWLVYHAARIVFGFTLLLLIGWIAQRTLPRGIWQVVGYLLAVTASSWPIVAIENGQILFYGYMRWWSVMDNLLRIIFIPHILVGQALIIVLCILLADDAVLKRWRNWFLLGFGGFVLGIIFPPGLLFVWVVLGVLIMIEIVWILRSKQRFQVKTFLTSRVIPRVIVLAMSAPSLLYLNLMLTFYPWKRLAEFDVLHPLPFRFVEYFQAVGPVLPLGLFGLILAFARKETSQRAVIAWVIAWLACLGVFRYIPQQSPLRFSEMTPHIPLAILTAYLFLQLYISGVQLKKYAHVIVQKISFILPFTVIVTGIFLMVAAWIAQRDFLDHKMRADYPLVPTGTYVMYPMKEFTAAMRFLEENTPRDIIVLSDTTAGNYIPVYAGKFVYIGHDNTVGLEQKTLYARAFFSGRTSVDDARKWIAQERMSYVFFGPQEMENNSIKELGNVYPFLSEVYRSEWFRIYKVE